LCVIAAVCAVAVLLFLLQCVLTLLLWCVLPLLCVELLLYTMLIVVPVCELLLAGRDGGVCCHDGVAVIVA
jgi:hypothetical protein